MNITTSDFESLFLSGIQLLDVRAPVEFQAGAVPDAINLPLLDNHERHQVGLTYKLQGQNAAIELGHKLVGGNVKSERIKCWIEAAKVTQSTVIYCFRGGLRSRTVQSWLKENGVDLPIVEGGYKALRRYLTDQIGKCVQKIAFEVVSGPTGSGKTTYLKNSGQPYLDLEALANHRGSAFGGYETPQPTQVNFENALAVEMIRLARLNETVLIENESRLVGKRTIPAALFEKMKISPKRHLNVELEKRVENIFKDYILDSALGQKNDPRRFLEFRISVEAISRRLGGLRAQEILEDLSFSQAEFLSGRGLDSNRVWIRKLLLWYYDPLYRKEKILKPSELRSRS